MQINAPCIITARLLPGLQIGDSFLSIEYGEWSSDNRQIYTIYLDTPSWEYVIGGNDGVMSGVGGGTLQEGLSSCLSFMSACAESLSYRDQTGRGGDNADLFPVHVGEWCQANDSEIQCLQCELEETPNAIEEE